MTAAKPEEANHKERTMDAALLSRSLKPQLLFMLSLPTTTSKMKIVLITTTNKPRKEIKTNTLILKLTNMELAPFNNQTAKIIKQLSITYN